MLSAAVSGGAAYVAIDYVTSPFSGGSVPMAETIGPFLAEAPRAAPLPTLQAETDAAPAMPDLAGLPPAPELGTPTHSPVRRIYGEPPLQPDARPARTDRLLAYAPAPRPEFADSFTDSEVETAPAQVTSGGPVTAASTFAAPSEAEAVEPGLVASLVPQTRPAGFAAVVASARRPATEDTATTVEVARAATPEVEAPRLELASIGPIRGADNPCTGRLARDIPGRPRSAPAGSEVIAALDGLGGADRDARVLQAAFSGNIPDFLRNLRPVSFTGTTGSGQQAVVTICVTPDYLALGSDRDFVRVPLGLPAALQVADRFDMMLPTTRMVDAIYAQADLRLSPQPMTPGPQMASTNYFLRHDGMVDEQMARAGGRLGLLVAGQKKDVVLANRLSSNPGRVAIYGWHRSSGSPIQPLSTVHGAQYADYSHGIRLVSRTAFINGRAVDLGDLLTDARYATLLNSDGPLTGRAIQLASLR